MERGNKKGRWKKKIKGRLREGIKRKMEREYKKGRWRENKKDDGERE